MGQIEKSWQDAYNAAVKAEKNQTLQEANQRDTMGASESEGSARYALKKKAQKNPYGIKVSEQAWRQIQAQRMQLSSGWTKMIK